MPTYMTLIKYTQKGIENMKDSPNRLGAVLPGIRKCHKIGV